MTLNKLSSKFKIRSEKHSCLLRVKSSKDRLGSWRTRKTVSFHIFHNTPLLYWAMLGEKLWIAFLPILFFHSILSVLLTRDKAMNFILSYRMIYWWNGPLSSHCYHIATGYYTNSDILLYMSNDVIHQHFLCNQLQPFYELSYIIRS